jgi:hypothetical protein
MRPVPGFLVGCCLGVSACGWRGDSDFPESAVEFNPPAYFRTWWQVVEECSGGRASYDEVSWYTAPHSDLLVRGEPAWGAWFAQGNRIALANGTTGVPPLVRHEMLHAILRVADHPAAYFQQKCADEVVCGRECGAAVSRDHAREVTRETLHVYARSFPETPSLTAQEGKVTIVVHVRNPSNDTVFVRMGTAICHAGFLIESVTETTRKRGCDTLPGTFGDRVYFAPGEIMRIVFEADLVAGWSNGPPGAGPITVSAVLADNIRETRTTSILP